MPFTAKSRLVVAGFTISLAFLPGARADTISSNLVANGSFLNGQFKGWTVQQNTSLTNSNVVLVKTDGVARPYPTGAFGQGIQADTLKTGSPSAGSGYAAYFSTDTGSQSLSQQITLSEGTYSIGFDMYVPLNGFNNPYNSTFSANVAGTNLYSQQSVDALAAEYGTNTWVTVDSVANVTRGGTYNVNFTFTGDGYPASDIVVSRVFVAAGNVNADGSLSAGGNSGSPGGEGGYVPTGSGTSPSSGNPPSQPVSATGGSVPVSGSAGDPTGSGGTVIPVSVNLGSGSVSSGVGQGGGTSTSPSSGGGASITGSSGGPHEGGSSAGISSTSSGGSDTSGLLSGGGDTGSKGGSGNSGGPGSGGPGVSTSGFGGAGSPIGTSSMPPNLQSESVVIKLTNIPRSHCIAYATNGYGMPVSIDGGAFMSSSIAVNQAETACKKPLNTVSYLKSVN